MTAENLPESPTAPTLEQLEQRRPQLASLLALRSKKNQKQTTTKPLELEDILNHQGSESLSSQEKQVMGKWLQSHYDRIVQKMATIDTQENSKRIVK